MEIVSESAPTSVAAAALYYYCTKKGLAEITRSLISEACSVSEVTIIKCNKRLLRYKEVADAYVAACEKMADASPPFGF
jgi:transcription initiation factor TFIIIB Brf1 subunit/transcription initiation factor TFIIB